MTSTRESTNVELRPFGDDDVAPAGLLLAVRHRAHTNRESSRAWRALGFTETFRRLHRYVAY